jgi:large subunit ribosomal protein L21
MRHIVPLAGREWYQEEGMAYAIIATGGKQYKVQEGDTLQVEKLPGNVGDTVSFDRVLMVCDDDNIDVGNPTVSNATVSGRILAQTKAPKIVVFKARRRKRYRSKTGHRQPLTAVKIDAIHV